MMGVKAEFLYPERAMESNHMKANPRENSKLAGKKVTRGKFSFLEGGQDRAHRALREGSPSPALRLRWGRLSRIHPGRTDPANSRGGSWGVRPALGSHLCHLGLGAKQGDPTDGRGSTGAKLRHPQWRRAQRRLGEGWRGHIQPTPCSKTPGSSHNGLREASKSIWKVNGVQAELWPSALSSRMSSTGCRVMLRIEGREGARGFVIDFLENCLSCLLCLEHEREEHKRSGLLL